MNNYKNMINVTKTYMPDKERYKSYIDRIYDSEWVTNRGELVEELEVKLKKYLNVKHLVLVANGSLALQVAFKALELTGEVITTPFSFPATTSTLVWEGLKPVYADIDNDTFNINPKKIEGLISKESSAIVPVHVFGNACEVEEIQRIANKNNLKVIYDAAHAFGVRYKDNSILDYGNISTLSFHATKLFHTIEGGAIITNDEKLEEKIRLMINFGIAGPEEIRALGINAKMNEFEAAMGLCVLEEINEINTGRRFVWERYSEKLRDQSITQSQNTHASKNYSYFPVLFENEDLLLEVDKKLREKNIRARRYFYPSLDTLPYIDSHSCPVSRNISSRILCLPIYPDLEKGKVDEILSIAGLL